MENLHENIKLETRTSGDGYRIWFDDGIDPGSEWASNIERHIKESSYFISFISKNYFESDNCKDELDCARNCGIHRLLIYLEDAAAPEGINMRVSRIQAIYWNKYKGKDQQQFYERLYSAENINECCAIKSDRTREQETDVLHTGHGVKDSQSQRNTSNNRKITVIPICVLAIVAVAAICFGIYSFSSKTASDNTDATEELLAGIDNVWTDTSEQTDIEGDDDLTVSNSNNSEEIEEQEMIDETVSESSSLSNVLMSDVCSNTDSAFSGQYSVFYTDLQRNEIISITFLDTLEDAPDDAWDFSENGDGTVKGWAEFKSAQHGYELYIAADGGVVAPSDCTGLFNGYTHVKSIDFGTAFHTENVTSMKAMFANCMSAGSHGSLDLSGFDTSNVTDMSEMFYLCFYLASVDLSSFDTSNVTDMHDVFNDCFTLSSLDLSGFDTSKVTDMSNMFINCSSLESLNLRSFDTSCVTNMSHMFTYCKNLTNFSVSRFDTSSVTDMSYMFYGCVWMTLDSVINWDVSNVENYENFMDDEEYVTLFE